MSASKPQQVLQVALPVNDCLSSSLDRLPSNCLLFALFSGKTSEKALIQPFFMVYKAITQQLPCCNMANRFSSSQIKFRFPYNQRNLMDNQQRPTQLALVPVQNQANSAPVYVDQHGRYVDQYGNLIPQQQDWQIMPAQTYTVDRHGQIIAPATQHVRVIQTPGTFEFTSISVSSSSAPAYYQQPVQLPPQPQPAPVAPARSTNSESRREPSISDVKFSWRQIGQFACVLGVALTVLLLLINSGQKDARIDGMREGAQLVRP
jgi:hypothetical protein